MALIDNLISYWKLDESSGNAVDSHTGGNTLTNKIGVWKDKVNTDNYKEWVPLWSQRQLQGMLDYKCDCGGYFHVLVKMKEYEVMLDIGDDLDYIGRHKQIWSMEQFLLCIVMKEKFNLLWNSEGWITQEYFDEWIVQARKDKPLSV